MKKILSLFTVLGLAFSPTAFSADDAPAVQVKRLSLSAATTIAQGAIAECSKRGIQIGVTVVDRDGTPQVMLRDTVAPPITIQISKAKAYTAANFMAATSQMGERANTPIGRVPGVVMSAGGLPIEAGGSFLGGVGVSGAPSGKTDEECAQAGIDAVMDELEMM